MMPDEDGFDTLALIRENHDSDVLAVIMVTASNDSRDVVRAMGSGANDYVVKPIDFDVLLVRLDRVLRTAQQSRLISALSTAQGLFISGHDPADVFGSLLSPLLQLTRSAYGFVGEVLHHEDDSPYLSTYASASTSQGTTNSTEQVTWTAVLDNIGALVGEALQRGKPFTDNAHPELENLLGVPICARGNVIGLIGLAGRPGEYDDGVLALLEPFLTSCVKFVTSLRIARQNDL
jgi:hypothetical protein